MENAPVLGVVGGSGLYNMSALKQVETLDINTPFGKPSAPLIKGTLAGKPVVFLARHGIGHHIPPSEVNYRANIYALKMVGVKQVVSISACGSLRDDYAPGHVVIPDQIFDFTRGMRQQSFFGEGLVAHVGSANPFCPSLSANVYRAVNQVGAIVHSGGTLITIEGPRFSTRGESNLFRSWGMSLIGMTACPEAFLAREAEMCYATMAHVTDYDVWHTSEESVTVEMVVKTLMHNTEAAQKAIEIMVSGPVENVDCECQHALKDAIITQPSAISPQARERVALLVDPYLKK